MTTSISQNPPSHFDDGMSRRNLFRTDLHAIKNGIAPPHTLLVIYRLQDLFIPLYPLDQLKNDKPWPTWQALRIGSPF